MFFAIEIILILKYFGSDAMVAYNVIGFAFVLYYIYAEYLLKHICLYCTAVHISVILLLAISVKCNMKKA